MSSPSFDSLAEPQQGQLCGAGDHHALTRQMIRERFSSRRPLAREGSDRDGGLRMFGGIELIFGRVGLCLLELKLQLVEQPRRALGARSVNRAPCSFFDLKIEMRDQRAPLRQFSGWPRRRTPSPPPLRSAPQSAPLSTRRCRPEARKDRRPRITWNHKIGRLRRPPFCVSSADFSPIRPPSDAMSLAACANRCPTADRKAGPSRSSPFRPANDGHRNRPRSNRFEKQA